MTVSIDVSYSRVSDVPTTFLGLHSCSYY